MFGYRRGFLITGRVDQRLAREEESHGSDGVRVDALESGRPSLLVPVQSVGSVCACYEIRSIRKRLIVECVHSIAHVTHQHRYFQLA
jgi:hypothetical protein